MENIWKWVCYKYDKLSISKTFYPHLKFSKSYKWSLRWCYKKWLFFKVLESCKKSQKTNLGNYFRGYGFEWDKSKRGFWWKYNKLDSLLTGFHNSPWLRRYTNNVEVNFLKMCNFPELEKITNSSCNSYKQFGHGL